MPRANRIFSPGLVWHITHRCHQRSFLLRFARDRRRWRHWLFEAKRRYDVCILNYIVTCNHVHLLVRDRGHRELSAAMRLVAGRTAQEYNRRKSRSGAFWEDRYHATAVQANEHLMRCMTYIDLNMVRAGAVGHPAQWDISGYSEIQNCWKRKGVIDLDELCHLLNASTIEQLQAWLKESAEVGISASRRAAVWTEAVAIGDEEFLLRVRRQLGAKGLHRRLHQQDGRYCLRDRDA